MSFCIYDSGYQKEGQWAFNIRSVIVFGKIEVIRDIDRIVDNTTKLRHKFTQDEAYIQDEIEKHAHRTLT